MKTAGTIGDRGVIDESWKYVDGCPAHQYDSVKVISRSPDIMIIEGFLTKFEAEYLIKLAYVPSLPPSPMPHLSLSLSLSLFFR